MYDALRNRYRFTCPSTDGNVERPLSALRSIERLAGAASPPVYRVTYGCAACAGEHAALLTERDLDVDPVAPRESTTFRNLLTGRDEPVAPELADRTERKLRRGVWPWTFYCACEHDVRPGYPSRLARLAPTRHPGLVGVAVRCAACDGVSINIVSERHLDEPFYHDPTVRFVDRPLAPGAGLVERFTHELWSGAFDHERNRFAA